jgi:hypothetical protein
VKVRVRHRVRRPMDLTSLFDVLFIVVFVALIRAAAAMHAEAEATRPPPPKQVAPRPPEPPADVAKLRMRALANLTAELAGRTPIVVRVSAEGVIEAIEADGKKLAVGVALLQHDPDPLVRKTYSGDRTAQLRVCWIAARQLGVPDLARHVVIVAPARALTDLSDALAGGLERDVSRCLIDQHGIATIVPPADPVSP